MSGPLETVFKGFYNVDRQYKVRGALMKRYKLVSRPAKASVGKATQKSGDKNILIHVEGKAVSSSNGYELRYLLKTLSCLEDVADRTYLYAVGKNRMASKEKGNFKIIIHNIQEGSFMANLQFVLNDIVLPVTPFLLEHAGDIWTMLKYAYDFIKVKLTATREGNAVTMNTTGDGNVVLNVSGNNNAVYVFPQGIPELAQNILPAVSELAKSVDGENIEHLTLGDAEPETISIDEADKELFESRNYFWERDVFLSGKIDVANANNFRGKVHIFSNGYGVEVGEYPFSLDETVRNTEFLKACYLEPREYRCRVKINFNPSKSLEEEIVELVIMGIA